MTHAQTFRRGFPDADPNPSCPGDFRHVAYDGSRAGVVDTIFGRDVPAEYRRCDRCGAEVRRDADGRVRIVEAAGATD